MCALGLQRYRIGFLSKYCLHPCFFSNLICTVCGQNLQCWRNTSQLGGFQTRGLDTEQFKWKVLLYTDLWISHSHPQFSRMLSINSFLSLGNFDFLKEFSVQCEREYSWLKHTHNATDIYFTVCLIHEGSLPLPQKKKISPQILNQWTQFVNKLIPFFMF